MQDLKKLMESVIEVSRKIAEEGREVMPAFFAEDAKGDLACYMTPWQDDKEKQKIVAFLRATFVINGVVQYVHVSESWMAEYKKDPSKDNNYIPPSQRKDRREALVLVGVDHEKTLMATAFINNLADSKKRTVEPLVWYPENCCGGTMAELLPPKDIPEWIKEMAPKIIEAMGLNAELLKNPSTYPTYTVH